MNNNFAQKAAESFNRIIFIGAIATGFLVFLFYEVYQKIFQYAGILWHKITVLCGCTEMSQLISMHPVIFGTLLLLGVSLSVFLLYSLFKLVRLIRKTKKFIELNLDKIKINRSSKLRRAILSLHLSEDNFLETKDSQPVVFCFGLIQPKVCLSDSLVSLLNQDELAAVLLHEYHHLRSKDPLKRLIVKCLQKTFFFLPGFGTMVKKYTTLSELAADELATNNFSDRSKLAKALLKVSEREEQILLKDNLAPAFSSVLDERAEKLFNKNYVPKFILLNKRFVLGLLSVAVASLFLMIFLSDTSKAFAMHEIGTCGLTISHSNGSDCDLADHQKIHTAEVFDCSQHTACQMN